MAPASELPFPTPSIKVKGRESAWRRFIKAFCVAIGVYFLLALLAKLSIQFATMHLIQVSRYCNHTVHKCDLVFKGRTRRSI